MASYFHLSVLFSLLIAISITTAEDAEEVPDMFGLMNILYYKADSNQDDTVSLQELNDIFDTMDTDNNRRVTRDEFTSMWAVLTLLPEDVSEAFFLLWDANGDGELDSADSVRTYTIFDLNGDGIVSDREFNTEFQRIYHRLPFVVLFERADRANDNNQHLTKTEFASLFASLSENDDIAKSDFEAAWTKNQFGSVTDADYVFDSFDKDKDGSLTKVEVEAKFDALDISGDGALEIREAYVLGDAVPFETSE